MRIARPAHPGQFIRMEVIEPLGLSVTDAAKVLSVTRPALSALLNGHSGLSAGMAIRIEKAFGPKMDTLLRMQTAYELTKRCPAGSVEKPAGAQLDAQVDLNPHQADAAQVQLARSAVHHSLGADVRAARQPPPLPKVRTEPLPGTVDRHPGGMVP